MPKLFCGVALLPFTLAPAVHARTPGDEDTSFAVGPTAGGSLYALALQPNGQALVGGGGFTAFRGANRGAGARLNADGTIDPTFQAGAAVVSSSSDFQSVEALALRRTDCRSKPPRKRAKATWSAVRPPPRSRSWTTIEP